MPCLPANRMFVPRPPARLCSMRVRTMLSTGLPM